MSVTDEYASDVSLQWALDKASQVKQQWHSGASPNLAGVLETYPGLRRHRTVVIELAYEEYSLRKQVGDAPDPGEFSRRFRSFERSIECYLAVRSIADADSNCATSPRCRSWPEPGCRFLDFDLLREIGRGAAGRVFLATEDELGGRRVALKVTVEGGREAKILGRLQHANIVPVYSIKADETSSLTGCCMPYLGQATLASVIDCVFTDQRAPVRASSILTAIVAANEGAPVSDSQLPPSRIFLKGSYIEGVALLGAQLAEALAHAHGQNIIHRDMKPSNILMATDGRPLLLDFNLSVDSQSPLWRIGGTLPYMAPEELYAVFKTQRTEQRCDPRSDIFSLGVILYELLSGVLPFGTINRERDIETVAARLRKRQRKGPRPLRQRNHRVDKRLAGIIESCLAFDPELRPATANELASALRKELSVARCVRRWGVAHRGLVMAIVLAAMLIGAGAVAYFMLRPPYAVRQFRLGLEYCEKGQDDMALKCLDASLETSPNWSAALIIRARVRRHRGEFQLAFADYDAADRLTPSPKTAACKGYCLSRLGQDKQAAMFYRRAIDGGYDSPAVQNNLGYSLLQLGQLDQAEDYLRKAAQADDARAAYLNLVVVYVRQALAGKAISSEAVFHARRAEKIGPPSGELYRNLALFYTLAAKQDAAWEESAIDCIVHAVAHGIDPKSIESDPIFSDKANKPAFQKALIRQGGPQGPINAARVVDATAEVR
jgi:serine/threonine protein kinase